MSRLLASYMAECGDQLVELRVRSRTADVFNPRLTLSDVFNTMLDFGIRLSDELNVI